MYPKPLTDRSSAWAYYLVFKRNIRRDRPWCRMPSAGKTLCRRLISHFAAKRPVMEQPARAFVSARVWRLAIAYPIRRRLSEAIARHKPH